jgi:S-adenosylmethionine:tRNA ribosyltransferase-isomerase
MPLRLEDFDYELPPRLIAQYPLHERSASRLLVTDGPSIQDRCFNDLPELLAEGDLLVLNDTRVIRARLHGSKPSGGKLEVLVERLIGHHEALAQVRASHMPRPGTGFVLDGGTQVEVVAREGEFLHLRFPSNEDLLLLLQRRGKVPLPPYIEREAHEEDESRYQTVFARDPGSVAAPTAGLHFDDALLTKLRDKGIETVFLTLHVGAGTFQPVRVSSLARHRMHRERYILPQETVEAIRRTREHGGRIVAVGTTSLRTLEAAAQEGELLPGAGDTDLFILPGFRFRIAEGLITNFHLPRSTLLMLVCAFGGIDHVRRAYRHAVEREYRFFSYGDAMFIARCDR